MNAQAKAWSEFSTRTQRVDPAETRAAMIYASQHNLQFSDALEILRGREYERAETMDGRYPTTDDHYSNR